MIYLITIIFLLVCHVCLGAEAPTSKEAEMTDFLYRILNFGLMLAILYIVAKKTAIKDFFTLRKEEIKKKFEELQNQKYEFEKKADELEAKLKEIEAKKKEIIERFRMEGLKEKEKIIAEAKERAAHIIAQADAAIEKEIQVAKEHLKVEIVEMAAQKAKEIISQTIKDKDQNKLVEEFIEKVEKLH
ncbi:MAG: hypothetical protein DRG39_03315 [Deltaproteobacteria bacterium]|nr:MAG: hypothetical protein DRG39_03315 [Deltaproteobacteria bacterium]